MRISWSALQRWEQCHRMEMLTRAGAAPRDIDKRNFLTGNITDHAMRSWLDQDNPQPGDLVGRADEQFERWTNNGEKIIWKGPGDKAKVLADAREALEKMEPWLIENVLPFEYQPEARGWAEVALPDPFGGSIAVELFYAVDILVRREGKFHIYDLKTTRNNSYVKGKTMAQLPYYGLTIAQAFGLPIDDIAEVAFVTPLCDTMLTALTPTEDDYRYLLSRLSNYAYAVVRSDMQMRETRDSVCTYNCAVSKSCPRGAMPVADSSGRVDFMEIALQRGG